MNSSQVAGDFGNEGTGGHSHLKYKWKTGRKQRFIVTAKPTDATHTIYSGYYFHPDKKQWVLISSWKAPKEGACTVSVRTSAAAMATYSGRPFTVINGFARLRVSGSS